MLCNPTSQSVAFASSAGSCALICVRSSGDTPADAPNKTNETSACQRKVTHTCSWMQCSDQLFEQSIPGDAHATYSLRPYAHGMACPESSRGWSTVKLSDHCCYQCSLGSSLFSDGPQISQTQTKHKSPTPILWPLCLTQAPELIG